MEGVRKVFLAAIALLTLATAAGCYPVMKKEALRPGEALRQVCFFFHPFRDDMDRESLTLAVRRNLEYLDRLNPEIVFHYGPHDFTIRQVRESQEVFLDLLSKGLEPGQLSREIKKKFRVYRAMGQVGNRRVLFTMRGTYTF